MPRSDLAALAAAVLRLSPSRHDPEAFHIQKSQIAHELRKLASDASQCRAPHLLSEGYPSMNTAEARAHVRARIGKDVPISFDSAVSILSWGARQCGHSDFVGINSPAAAKAIFDAAARNPKPIAMDSRAAASFADRYPDAAKMQRIV